MRFSLAYEMQRPVVDDHAVIKETLEQCVLADKMGFDAVWFVEHHFLTSFSMSPCPEVIFGALSELTKNIRLGFGVVVLPCRRPVRVAERVAIVDHLSGGRVEFHTELSAPSRTDRDGHQPPNTRDMSAELPLEMIPKIWQDGSSEWEGKFLAGATTRVCAPSRIRSRIRASGSRRCSPRRTIPRQKKVLASWPSASRRPRTWHHTSRNTRTTCAGQAGGAMHQ